MPAMHVGEVSVAVTDRLVAMRMRMRMTGAVGNTGIMRMIMMEVIWRMHVLMFDGFVLMFVFVPFG